MSVSRDIIFSLQEQELGGREGRVIYPLGVAKNGHPIFIARHALTGNSKDYGGKLESRCNEILSASLLGVATSNWYDVVKHMLDESFNSSFVTQIRKKLESLGPAEKDPQLTFAISIHRYFITPEGKDYIGEYSMVGSISWPLVGGKFYQDKVKFKDDLITQSGIRDDDKISRKSLSGMQVDKYMYYIHGFGSQYAYPPEARKKHHRNHDTVYPPKRKTDFMVGFDRPLPKVEIPMNLHKNLKLWSDKTL